MRSDFVISKELESKPLGIITCTQTVPSWAKSWQWQLHWRICLLHPFYKNNRTHPEVVLNTFFFRPNSVPLLTAQEYERTDTCRSPGTAFKGGTLRSRRHPVFTLMLTFNVSNIKTFYVAKATRYCFDRTVPVTQQVREPWRGGLLVSIFSFTGQEPKTVVKYNIHFREKPALLNPTSSTLLGWALPGQGNSDAWPLHRIRGWICQ